MDGPIEQAGDESSASAAWPVRQRLRSGLTAAMKARDQVRIRALRAGIGAIDNAESVVHGASGDGRSAPGPIAGAAVGVGATEVARRELDAEQVASIIRREIDERLAAADEFERAGVPGRATDLRDEAEVLTAFLAG